MPKQVEAAMLASPLESPTALQKSGWNRPPANALLTQKHVCSIVVITRFHSWNLTKNQGVWSLWWCQGEVCQIVASKQTKPTTIVIALVNHAKSSFQHRCWRCALRVGRCVYSPVGWMATLHAKPHTSWSICQVLIPPSQFGDGVVSCVAMLLLIPVSVFGSHPSIKHSRPIRVRSSLRALHFRKQDWRCGRVPAESSTLAPLRGSPAPLALATVRETDLVNQELKNIPDLAMYH